MCGRAAKCIIDSLLLFLLSLQTFLLLTLTYQGYWDLPTWLLEMALAKHAPKVISVEIDSARLYPRKGIEIQGIQLNSTECICPLLTIEKILLVPSDPMIGKSESALGLIQNAVFYFPDPYLPEADNLKLVDDLSIRFEINRKVLKLQSFKARISKLKLASLNTLELKTEYLRSLRKHESKGFSSEEVFKKLREIRFLHDYFADAEEALMTFNFQQESEQKYTTDINLFAASSLMLEHRVASKGIYLFGKLIWDGELYVDGMVEGELQSIRFGEDFKLQDVAFEFLYRRDAKYSLIPDRIRAHSADLEILNRSFDYLNVTAYPDDLATGRLEAGFGLGKQYVFTRSSYDLDAKQMHLQVEGDFDPILFAGDWTGEREFLDVVSFDAIPHVTGQLNVMDWNTLEDIRFQVIGENVWVKGVPFAYAKTKGSWDIDARKLVLDEFYARQPTYALTGKLLKSFSTSQYRYLLSGEGIPTDLNAMFKPWWRNLWKRFDFHEHPIQVDLDIWGMGNSLNDRHVIGSFAFEAIEYKGIQIDFGQVRLHAIPKYLDLFDLFVQRTDGVASGRIQSVYQADGSQQVSQRLDLYTNIPLHQIAPAAGSVLDPFVKNTNPEAVADVWLNGALISQEFPQYRDLDDLVIRLHIAEPTQLFGWEIDGADAVVHKRNDRFEVDPVSFQFAGGEGNAVFEVDGPEDQRILSFDVNLNDFDFRDAIEKHVSKPTTKLETEPMELEAALTEQGAGEEERIVPTEVYPTAAGKHASGGFKLKRPKDESFMDLTLQGSCPLGDLGGMQAVGSFVLDDPLIHRVHVFGGFSKLMDNAELNLGSFSLKQARSPLRISGQMLYLDDLELTGPSSRVKSKGSVDLKEGTLDFRLKAIPLGEVKFPVVAGLALVLRPFAQLFEVQLTGTLENPDWKIVIDPSGL